MRLAVFVSLALLILSPASSDAQTAPAIDSTSRDPNLPPSEQTAKAALETSPRHGEMIDIAWAKDRAPLRTWIAYPERKDKAGVVLIIHEIYGLTDWIRSVADQFAREGFIAVVPDLISGLGPGGGGTDSVPSRDDVVKLVRTLTPEETADRKSVV